MFSRNPEYREAQRAAGCRACSRSIEKGEKMVSWYSCWNSGMHIHLCKDCIASMYNLVFNLEQSSETTDALAETTNC